MIKDEECSIIPSKRKDPELITLDENGNSDQEGTQSMDKKMGHDSNLARRRKEQFSRLSLKKRRGM